MNIFGFRINFPWFPSKEKRRAERKHVFEALWLGYKSPLAFEARSGETVDISLTGVRFLSDSKLEKGARLELTLRFTPGSVGPAVQSIQVRAEVVRCYRRFKEKRYRVACVFGDLNDGAYQKIKTFLLWLKDREEKFLFFPSSNRQRID